MTDETPQEHEPKRSTQELTPPLQALLKDQSTDDPPPTPQDGDDMPVEPDLHDVERRVRQLESHRAYSEERLTRHTQRLDGHDLRIDGLLSKEQITTLITDTTKALIEKAIRDQWQPITEAMDRFDTLTNDITRAFAGDQMKRNKFERFVRRNIKEINQREETRQKEYDDFQERLGNWLIPMLGYNPNHPSDTRKPIVVPIVERVQNTDTKVGLMETKLTRFDAYLDKQDAKERSQQEWLNKAVPVFVQKIVFNPHVARALLALGSALLTLLGYQVTLGQ
jgi:hypothetical protein